MWNLLIPAAAGLFLLSKRNKKNQGASAVPQPAQAAPAASENYFPIVDLNERRPAYDLLLNDEKMRNVQLNDGPY